MLDNKSSKKRALVIEDEPVIGRVCSRILTKQGFDVDVASNGLIARGMSAEMIYDLYLSDIRTPEMSGIEFYHYFKNEYRELASRVIFITGDVLNAEVKEFLKEFKGTILLKPFTPNELKRVVEEFMNSYIS